MKIEIYKKENSEDIFFLYGEEEKILNFDNLKDVAKDILNNKVAGTSIEYELETSSDLGLYKTTFEDMILSISEDEELFELYKEKNSSDEVEKEESAEVLIAADEEDSNI